MSGKTLVAIVMGSKSDWEVMQHAPETLAELGIAGVDVGQWYGLFAPAGTPAAAIERLNQALNTVLTDPEVVERFESHGARTEPGDAHSLARKLDEDLGRWRGVVARAAIAPRESRQLALE